MKAERSFSQILDEKMGQKIPSTEPLKTTDLPSEKDPFFPTLNRVFFYDLPPKKVGFSRENIKFYQNQPPIFEPQASNNNEDVPLNEGLKEETLPPQRTMKTVKKEKNTPAFEVRPEQLSGAGKLALDQLRRLGALDLYASTITVNLIKKGFRNLARELHPDQNVDADAHTKKRLKEKYALLQESTAILKEELTELKKASAEMTA